MGGIHLYFRFAVLLQYSSTRLTGLLAPLLAQAAPLGIAAYVLAFSGTFYKNCGD